MTTRETIEKFRASMRDKMANSTLETYRYAVGTFCDLNRKKIPKTRRRILQIWEEWRESATPSTTVVMRAALNRFYVFMHDIGEISHNPIVNIRLEASDSVMTPSKGSSYNDIEQLLNSITEFRTDRSYETASRDYLIVELMGYHGLKTSEISKLTTNNFSTSDKTLIVGTHKSVRSLNLSPDTTSRMREYILNHRPTMLKDYNIPYLFVSARGNRLNRRTIWRITVTRAMQARLNPVDVSPAALRKGYGDRLIDDIQNGTRTRQEVGYLLGYSFVSEVGRRIKVGDKTGRTAIN